MLKDDESLRLAFMGTPDFSIPTLEVLENSSHDVCAVYTQPPRRAGRGKQEQKTPIHQFAENRSINVHTPTDWRSKKVIKQLSDLRVDMAIVVAYGLILPPQILNTPRFGCINIHASLLPRWRGAAPIQRAIMAGDNKTGISIMQMEPGLDTGPILVSEDVPISKTTTLQSLHQTLASLGASLINPTISAIQHGTIKAVTQPTNGITYAAKLSREDGHLDWTKSAQEIERLIRALNPWPGAWCILGNQRLKIFEAEVLKTESNSMVPGTILDKKLSIACGKDQLRLKQIQLPGKKVMNIDDFTRGTQVTVGTLLE
tara:strand:- start:458 stop:1402 length:945 start_codon:yes stop_codon:yes gene_type:complete